MDGSFPETSHEPAPHRTPAPPRSSSFRNLRLRRFAGPVIRLGSGEDGQRVADFGNGTS
jgi:hypothetical protein